MEQRFDLSHGIQEGDLLAYLDGSASPAVNDHVANCAICAIKATELQKSRAILRAAFFRRHCPSTDDLASYQAKELPYKQMQAVKMHLADCQLCRSELVELAAVLDAPLEQGWLDKLAEAGRQILTAVLLPQSSQPALAIRGAPRKEHIYQAGNYQISLTILVPPVNEGLWQIEGRVTLEGKPPAKMLIQLRQDNQVITEDALDEFGYFELHKLRGGLYTLGIESTSVSILIPDLKLV